MTKQKTQTALLKMAEGIRSKAAGIRKNKGKTGENAVDGIAGLGAFYGTNVAKYGEMVTSVATGVAVVCEEMSENPQLREQVVTLVANIVDNAAARLNELANIMEALSKSEKVQDAIVNANRAATDFAEVAHGIATIRKTTRARRKFKVIRPEAKKSSRKTTDKRTDA